MLYVICLTCVMDVAVECVCTNGGSSNMLYVVCLTCVTDVAEID